ncbi:MAG: GntR family transcriptional regulator [Candidatus Sumerlaeota bacterium]|nr:GntR family transcriptional regulator [Candidatus Sumerlaeota bacterium]
MYFELNFKSGKSIQLQIIEQVKYALAAGALRPGDQLPSIRALAEQLRVNRNTVAKAYSELEHEDVVKTEQGRGVFCCDPDSRLNGKERRRILAQSLDGVIVQAYHLQFQDKELSELLKERLKEFESRLKDAKDKD